jgi:uncharacterized repeat protein (TIGR04138 family)
MIIRDCGTPQRTLVGRLLLAVVRVLIELALIPLGLLAVWQIFGVGIPYGLGAAALMCFSVIPLGFALFAAHELGHLVAGWAVGLRFQSFTLWPVVIFREGDRLRVRLSTGWFQLVACVRHVVNLNADWPSKWAVMTSGGPLANLAVGILCLLAASRLNPGPPGEVRQADTIALALRNVAVLLPGDATTAYLNFAGLLSLFLGLTNLFPARVRQWRSDGGHLLTFWRLSSVARKIGSSVAAVVYIVTALETLWQMRRTPQGSRVIHVSAQEFCDYLLAFQQDSPVILRTLGICRSEDVGRVVFGLVNAGLMVRQESDSEADFQGLFVLDEATIRSYCAIGS